MRFKFYRRLAIVLFLAVTANTAYAQVKQDNVQEYRRQFGFPQYDGSVERQLARNVLDVSFDLYRAIGEEHGNCFFSPYSISMGLVMLWYGARGTTADEISRVLHLSLSGEDLKTAFTGGADFSGMTTEWGTVPWRRAPQGNSHRG